MRPRINVFSVWFEAGADVADRFSSRRTRQSAVREIARQASLPVAEKAESQEILLRAVGKLRSIYRGVFWGTRRSDAGGRRHGVTTSGESLGGIAECTITTVGQRKGLGIAREDRSTSSNLTGVSTALSSAMIVELRSDPAQVRDVKWISFAVLGSASTRDS